MDALSSLYPKLSPGGYVIIDDYRRSKHVAQRSTTPREPRRRRGAAHGRLECRLLETVGASPRRPRTIRHRHRATRVSRGCRRRSSSRRRLVVVFCVAVTLVALAWLYPQAFADANRQARANAALDYVDRELGGGNSVLPDQSIAIEARGRIPRTTGSRSPSESRRRAGANSPRRTRSTRTCSTFSFPAAGATAPWVLCFACDRTRLRGCRGRWEDEGGLAILRRPV